MESGAIELRNATLKASAKISNGRTATTLVLRAPLSTEAAETLRCREAVFTETGDVRPCLFRSAVLDAGGKPMNLQLQLDGIGRREIAVENAESGPLTIQYEGGVVTVIIKLVFRGPAQPQFALLSFAMEVGNAPLVCSLRAKKSNKKS
jgi:hypothetical protein